MTIAKPLGMKGYGSIGHLPGSKLGPGDHAISPGEARICLEKSRDQFDLISVTEKVDGSNTSVALINDQLLALGRSGYLAQTSPYEQHQLFAQWVRQHEERLRTVLREGERLIGEWLAQAHGTRYQLLHEPWVCFDLMRDHHRESYRSFLERIKLGGFTPTHLLHMGGSLPLQDALELLGEHGHHGALDLAEGVVYRVERNEPTGKKGEKRWRVNFLAKYVRSEKVAGCYLPEIAGSTSIWNWRP